MNMQQLIEQLKRNPPSDGTVVMFKSTVAGHHVFNKKPIPGMIFPLKMTRERNNHIHPNAFLIESGPANLYKKEIHARGEEQDLFGQKFGRCPRALADILAPLFDNGDIKQGRVVCTGKRLCYGNVVGGGKHLECIYMMKSKDTEAASRLVNSLSSNKYDIVFPW